MPGPNRRARNQRKVAILEALERERRGFAPAGWVTPAGLWTRHFIARASLRNIYVGLKRYLRWNLVEQRRSGSGRLMYRITQKGRERLQWLNEYADQR